MIESGSTPATDNLRREHESIRRGLRLLEHAGRRLALGQSSDGPSMTALVDLLRRVADQCHHVKEEAHLYPAMQAKGLPADDRLAALLAAHGEGRDYLETLAGLPSPAERAAAALLYVRVMRDHLDSEERDVFPLADRMFTPTEQADLARAYAAIERTVLGPGSAATVLLELERLEGLLRR
jgi:hemerythrin-like domain-containing protein